MKKITMLFLVMWTMWGGAQVKSYTFSQTTGNNYIGIASGEGTVLGNESNDTEYFVNPLTPLVGGAATKGAGFAIGFNFVFNGVAYDSFGVSTDGWISLGQSVLSSNAVDMSVGNSSLPLTSVVNNNVLDDLFVRIAAFTNNLQAQSGAELRYALVGSAPNRVLVVQWKNYKRNGFSGESLNFQIRLSETTNVVQFAYGNFQPTGTTTTPIQVGLRAAPSTTFTDFNTRKMVNGWSDSASGASTGDKMTFSNTVYPTSGLVFNWTPTACGIAKNFATTNITSSSATVSWSTSVPAPSGGYEYVISKSSTLPTGSGTQTSVFSQSFAQLDPTTVYYFYMRSNCGTVYTPWAMVGSFKTLCADYNTLFESFDFYAGGTGKIPDCWSTFILGGSNSCYISAISGLSASSPNSLQLYASAGATSYTLAVTPSFSNLHANTHRMRFKGFATTPSRTLEVGYLSNATDPSSFVRIGELFNLPNINEGMQEFQVSPSGIPENVTKLVFRVGGDAGLGTTVYIDNVYWEPIPVLGCNDISSLVAKQMTHNSTVVSWTPGSNEAKWQYVYAESSISLNPYSVSGTDVPGTSPIVTINGLNPTTSYNVWIRPVCHGSDYGAWIGPVKFTTICIPVSDIFESFDSTTIDTLPSCWAEVGTVSKAAVKTLANPNPPSGSNALTINGGTTNSPFTVVVALKPLSTFGLGTYRIKFKAKTSNANKILEIGYLTDISNASGFQLLQDAAVLASGYQSFEYLLGTVPQSGYLAFRVVGETFYVDDLVWELNPNCRDVSDISAMNVTDNSATLQWKVGNEETQWQYVKGDMTVSNPNLLTPQNFVSTSTIDGTHVRGDFAGLTSATSYKVWVRSICTGVSGGFVGPYVITTSCAPIDAFAESFDESKNIPDCWAKVGLNGAVGVATPSTGILPITLPNALSIATSANTGPVIVALPALNTVNDDKHRLVFKYRSDNLGKIEIGYLKNIADPASFVMLNNTTLSKTDYQRAAIHLSTDPATKVLAFRFDAVGSPNYYIDDVAWEIMPECPDVSDLKINTVSHSSVTFQWSAGAESQWEYVIAGAAVTNPATLTPVNVDSLPTIISTTKLSDNSSIAPESSYKVWVRSKCSTEHLGAWIGPVRFTTTCAPIANFSEDFNDLTVSPGSPTNLPDCWRRVSLFANQVGIEKLANKPNDGNKMYMDADALDKEFSIVSLSPVDSESFANHILKFSVFGITIGSKLEVGFLLNPNDPASFAKIETYTITQNSVPEVFAISFANLYLSNVIAFRNPGMPGVSSIRLYVDDVSWEFAPSLVPACVIATAAPDTSCGNYATKISWPAVNGAEGYYLNVGSASGLSDLVNNQNLNASLSTTFTGMYNKTYYYTIIPYNYLGSAHGCVEQSFSTNSQGCYCVSVPELVNIDGITNVVLGDSNFSVPKTTYKSFVSQPVNVKKDANTSLRITFNTFKYVYKTRVWIDFNDDHVFDEQTEKVFEGIYVSPEGTPSVLDASFTILPNVAIGPHRMRVIARNASLGDYPDPCFNGSYAETLDFTVNVVFPVVNDEPIGAVGLNPGIVFETNPVVGSNQNATGGYLVDIPACGEYFGADVWYKSVVPSTGKLTFEVNSVTEGLVNTAAALYSGSVDQLQVIACDDSGSAAGDNHPRITAENRTPGETLYFRVWENGGDAYGNFKVSAYDDSSLSTDAFNTINFRCYPIPVKDVFNVSFDKEIKNISVTNLLGQIIVEKSINSTQGKVDMSGLSSGTYLVKIAADNQFKTIKVIKE